MAKSDCLACWVDGEPPLRIEIVSSVKTLFGAAIERCARATAADLGVARGELRIEDDGALDYVIAARVEAALRTGGRRRAPSVRRETGFPALVPSRRDRPRRSRLYLPGNQPDLLPNAGLFGADCLILDLEDSVPPSRKGEARILVRRSLEAARSLFGTSEIIVRINPLSGEWGALDLAEFGPCLPEAILLPKCESAAEVERLDRELSVLEAEGGFADRFVHVLALVETARGVLASASIATASPRLVALCFGAEDFSRDIGARRTSGGSETLFARQTIVVAAKAAGIQAHDSVFSDLDDEAGFEAWCQASRALGFDGIGLVHPRQIEIANRAFSPSTEELDEARRVVAALAEAEGRASGVASLDGRMVDAPVAARARRLLDLAASIAPSRRGGR